MPTNGRPPGHFGDEYDPAPEADHSDDFAMLLEQTQLWEGAIRQGHLLGLPLTQDDVRRFERYSRALQWAIKECTNPGKAVPK